MIAGHVDREAEERALSAYQQADERRTEDERRLGVVREALAAATAEAGDASTDQLAEQAEELERRYEDARRGASGLHSAHEELRRAEQERERRSAAQQEAALRTASRVARRDTLDRERATLEEALAHARGGAESVAARAAQLERQVALLTETAEWRVPPRTPPSASRTPTPASPTPPTVPGSRRHRGGGRPPGRRCPP